MIRINTSLFDWNAIRDIYCNKDGVLLPQLRVKVSDYLGRPHNQIARQLLLTWLCDEAEIPSNDKITTFLLNANPAEQIQTFLEKICEIFWGNKALAHVLQAWPIKRQELIETNDRTIRRSIITSLITPENICMFTGITLADLNAEPQNGSVYASKSRLQKIELSKLEEINAAKSDFNEIFNYDELAPRFRDKLLEAMHVSVCPYCNRQFITSFNKDGDISATADIDHFYGKKLYPFLALSLFNLVPSCQICNSRLKLTEDFFEWPHINPYQRGFDAEGIFKLLNIDPLLNDNTIDLDPNYAIVNLSHNEAIDNSIATFQLNSVYQSHKDYVGELIIKAKLYSDKPLDEYLHNFEGLFSGKEEMRRILYGTYLRRQDAGQRPLAKLTQDILSDLGITFE